ncbi:helix-turn-helix domain-containing protein [Garciella nitratireducens]|uniref:DNA-binding transcriptional regulator, XRE-family HTH domain n=1 Tax=Garciella nitratireducens DSM 15102 TaxID=1121911 RepID=A0A1T4K7H6_9FIRM|nr:helix-turn-helix transcriptional regulator [Garciella nitratireducens]SJZ38382.1 DNA-binding transcriptional regulator, XRE-family HTH domain [Garciella nitratireducens DSM 15102]
MFGDRLKALRNEKNMTQSELAKLLNVSPSTIGMYEQGRRDPDTKTLAFLAEYFDVTTDYLLGRTDIRTPEPETIAAHHEGDEFTEEELEEIEKFKEFVRMRRKDKK